MKRWLALLLLLMLPCRVQAEAQHAAWLPYWRAEAALSEAEALDNSLEAAVVFAAVFDRDNKLFLPEGAKELLLDTQVAFWDTDTTVYLSVVNDRQTRGGQYDNKSAALLRGLFRNERTIQTHIDDLLFLLDTCEADGLEIDYENLDGNRDLYARFTAFLEQLYSQLAQDGIPLRVVLSWDAAKYAQLPIGPEYTVMCYNLYGYHSGPGPKADFAFLDEIAALYRDIPNVRMALACGGFVWHNGRVAAAPTQQEAEALLSAQGVIPSRDPSSGALTASIMMDGEKSTLWYADGETLRQWQARFPDGTGFDLFSLGGANVTDWQNTILTPKITMEAE